MAGGRAKQRRLAQALLDAPQVLADGRSPAPRAIGDLLTALRKAGVHAVAADPVQTVVAAVRDTDPTLSAEAVTAAVRAAAPRTGQRYGLAWALQDRPDLLTGAGAQAPDPGVLRLIDAVAGRVASGWSKMVRTMVVTQGCADLGTVCSLTDGRRPQTCRRPRARCHNPPPFPRCVCQVRPSDAARRQAVRLASRRRISAIGLRLSAQHLVAGSHCSVQGAPGASRRRRHPAVVSACRRGLDESAPGCIFLSTGGFRLDTPTSERTDKGAGSGYDLPSLAELWRSHRTTANASEAVYLALRDAIAAGTIRPGEHLGEPAIAESLGISRTPIREALLKLETERFVVRTAGRRLVVAAVTPEEVLDVYAVREVLNGLAAKLAAENASTTDLIRLRKLHREMKWAFDDGNIARMARLNFVFHDAVGVASRNAFLLEMLRKAHDTHHRYSGSTFSLPERAAGSIDEHEQILRAIEARDGQRAGDLAQHHTARARLARISMLDGTVEELQRNRKAKDLAETETTG